MKTCTTCKSQKLEESFSWKNKNKGIRSNKCKDCQKTYARDHYNNNKKYYYDKAKRSKHKSRLVNRRFVYSYLSKNPCIDCGESDPVVLEFDHQGNKSGNVSEMIFVNGLDVIKKEINKCEVVCSNCHKRRTAKQFNFYKDVI